MKMRAMTWNAMALALGLLGACSSSSGDGDAGASMLACKGAAGSTGPGSSACNDCLQASCASQLSAIESPCAAYLACFETCSCDDLSCINGCGTTEATGACSTPFGSLGSCIGGSCMTPCAGPGPSDGGGE